MINLHCELRDQDSHCCLPPAPPKKKMKKKKYTKTKAISRWRLSEGSVDDL